MCQLQRAYNEVQSIGKDLTNDEQQFVEIFEIFMARYDSRVISLNELVMSIHRLLNLPRRLVLTQQIFDIDDIQEEHDLKLDIVGFDFEDIVYGEYVASETDPVVSGVEVMLLGAREKGGRPDCVSEKCQFRVPYSDILRNSVCTQCFPTPKDFIIHVVIEDEEEFKLLRIVVSVNPDSMGVCDTCLVNHAADIHSNVLGLEMLIEHTA